MTGARVIPLRGAVEERRPGLDCVPIGELRGRLAIIEAELHLEAVRRAQIARLENRRARIDGRIAELRGERAA